MNSLIQAVDSIQTKTSDVARADAVAELQGIVRDCEAAIRVWQQCADTTNGSENHWTLVSWLGAERVQQLHEINVSARTHLARLAEIAGPFGSGADHEDVIETAFRQTPPGQIGREVARAAIDRMNQRIAEVRALLERFRTVRPAAARARSAGGRRNTSASKRRRARRRSPAKRAKPKPVKKSRRKKAAKKRK